jgi:hypothetical protein
MTNVTEEELIQQAIRESMKESASAKPTQGAPGLQSEEDLIAEAMRQSEEEERKRKSAMNDEEEQLRMILELSKSET